MQEIASGRRNIFQVVNVEVWVTKMKVYMYGYGSIPINTLLIPFLVG
jgi:hypothetical protein